MLFGPKADMSILDSLGQLEWHVNLTNRAARGAVTTLVMHDRHFKVAKLIPRANVNLGIYTGRHSNVILEEPKDSMTYVSIIPK